MGAAGKSSFSSFYIEIFYWNHTCNYNQESLTESTLSIHVVLDPVFLFFCTFAYRYNPMGQVFERVSRFTEQFD